MNEPVPEARVRSALASMVVPAKVTAPSALRVEVVEIAPSEVIAPIPVIAPVVVISQSLESIATVLEFPPIATAPVEVPVAIFTAKLEEALRETAAPVTVKPAVVVIRPSEVIAPMPVKAPVEEMSQSLLLIAMVPVSYTHLTLPTTPYV